MIDSYRAILRQAWSLDHTRPGGALRVAIVVLNAALVVGALVVLLVSAVGA